MSGGNEFSDGGLWHRWREGKAEAGEAADEPDPLTLAAYAERRLGRSDADPETDPAMFAVEAWLAAHPEALDDIIAARSPVVGEVEASVVGRAQALIADAHANIAVLRVRRDGWRHAAALSGIAASMIAAVLVGFSLGNYDVIDLLDAGQVPAAEQSLIGGPGTILATDDEDVGI